MQPYLFHHLAPPLQLPCQRKVEISSNSCPFARKAPPPSSFPPFSLPAFSCSRPLGRPSSAEPHGALQNNERERGRESEREGKSERGREQARVKHARILGKHGTSVFSYHRCSLPCKCHCWTKHLICWSESVWFVWSYPAYKTGSTKEVGDIFFA